MKSKTFKVSKSRTVRIVTVTSWIIVAAALLPGIYLAAEEYNKDGDATPLIIMAATAICVAACLAYYYLISPKSIELTGDALILHRVAGEKIFPYADITEANVWEGKPSSLARTCGSGGFYGYIGWFAGGGLGKHYEYVGDHADAFYIKLRSGKTYMLSCDDSARVVDSLGAKDK